MVPLVFMVMESLPITRNGKINIDALPDPDRRDLLRNYLPPVTDLEKVLCDIWEEVLDLERVGILDNFFELGGHSLLVTKVITHLQSFLKTEVPLKLFFKAQSIQELAANLNVLDLNRMNSNIEEKDVESFEL